MAGSTTVAKLDLDLKGQPQGVEVRILIPEWDNARGAWACRFEIDPPIAVQQAVFGESSLQALALALKLMASTVYGSSAYKDGRLGAFGEFGGYLGFPAPKEFLELAPYPF